MGSIVDVTVSQLIPEPFNLLLEDEKHEALDLKRTAKYVSESKSHFTFIIGVILLRQESLNSMASILIVANFYSSSAKKKNLLVAMSRHYQDIPNPEDDFVRYSDKGS